MASESKTVCTVILNWNQPGLTAECARAALAQEAAGGQHVLIVDNGSTPENRDLLQRTVPAGCEIAQNDRNLGFAGGMNVGIRHALDREFDFVWLLNNDAFPDPSCLAALLAALDADPRLAAVTPALVGPDGQDQQVGAFVDWHNGSNPAAGLNELEKPTDRVGATIIGTALLVRTAAIRAVGGFDPRFFLYREEDDLCARLTRGGLMVAAVPAARCVHLEKASSGGGWSPLAAHLLCRNSFLLLRNHLALGSLIPAMLGAVRTNLQQAASYSDRNPTVAAAVVGGVWSGATWRFGKPARLTAPKWFERFALSHWWRIAQVLGLLAAVARLPFGRTVRFQRLRPRSVPGTWRIA